MSSVLPTPNNVIDWVSEIDTFAPSSHAFQSVNSDEYENCVANPYESDIFEIGGFYDEDDEDEDHDELDDDDDEFYDDGDDEYDDDEMHAIDVERIRYIAQRFLTTK